MTAWTSSISGVTQMKVIAGETFPTIYNAISRYDVHSVDRYHHCRSAWSTLYHCLSCGIDYEVHHRFLPICGGGADDKHVVCPNCGTVNTYRSRFASNSPEHVPEKIWLSVKELKDEVVLEISGDCVRLDDNRDWHARINEAIRFNIRKRQTRYLRWLGRGSADATVKELGNPLRVNDLEDSLLYHLRADNLSKESKPQALRILKALRETIQKKWKKIHGYELKNLFVGSGTSYGYMIFPVVNIAYRIVYVDAPNLPSVLKDAYGIHCIEKWVQSEKMQELLYGDLELIRKSPSFVDVIIDKLKLDNIPSVRRAIREEPFMAPLIQVLRNTFSVDPNHYLAIFRQMCRMLVHGAEPECSILYCSPTQLLKYMREVFKGRSGSEIRRYMATDSYQELMDIYHMLQDMPKPVREKAVKVKLKELHDWLVEQQALLEHEGFNLEIPEHIVRRFQMQADQVKFYLPEHSTELMKGGKLLHNCVGSYGGRVANGECNIVYMTDDKGKLTACLEVRGDRLVQAKLKYNKSVYHDPAINDAIVDWCEKTGLTVDTGDVAVHKDEKEVREAV